MGEDQSNTVYDDNYGSCNSGPSVSVHTPLQCWNSEGWSDESWNEHCFDNNYEPLTELLPEEQHNNENSIDVSGYTSSQSDDSEIEALASDKLSDVEDEPTSLLVDSTPTRELSCCNLLLKQFAIRHHITQDALSDLLELFLCMPHLTIGHLLSFCLINSFCQYTTLLFFIIFVVTAFNCSLVVMKRNAVIPIVANNLKIKETFQLLLSCHWNHS